jgi:hypothetical protein
MKAVIQPIRSELGETTACNGATETERDLRLMQSTEALREIPKGEAALMPIGGPRKERRVRNLAAERRQKRKERARGYRGTRRNVSRRAKVAWRIRNLIRNIRTIEKCGWRKEFAAARIRTTRCAKVARRKGCSYEGPSVGQGRGRIRPGIKLQEKLE